MFAFGGISVAQEKCPNITVTGPAGATYVGDTMTFAATVKVSDPDKLGYNWSISAGTIEQGLGRPWIVVRAGQSSAQGRISATVEINGLPKGCPNQGTEAGAVITAGDPLVLAEIEVFSGRRFYSELDYVAHEFAKFPNFILYSISFRASGENLSNVTRREKLIKDYLTKTHKIDPASIQFIRGPVSRRLVIIHAVPPSR